MELLPDRVQKFIDYAKLELEASGVGIEMPGTDFLEFEPGQYCSGYFDDEGPVFAVAVGREWELWFPIFVHEFGHFHQWRSRRDWWEGLKVEGGEGLELVLEHFAGDRELSLTEVVGHCMASAECEAECEVRVLRMIEQYGLPIDAKEYAQKANAYITYYYAMPELGAWCNGERPYEVEEVVELMPDHMDLTGLDYWRLAQRAMPLFKERCVYAGE